MAEPPTKRFKYASYNDKLKEISVNKGKGKAVGWEDQEFLNEEGHATPFTSELARCSLHDLTLPYQALARDLLPLTPTLPITLLNLKPISEILSRYFSGLKDGEDHLHSGLNSALSLVQALYATCLGEAAPFLPSTAKDLLRTGKLRALEPRLAEKSFSTLAEVLRQVGSVLLKAESDDILRQIWSEVVPYLHPSENKRYVRRCAADVWVAIIRKARGEGLKHLIGIMLQDEHQGMEAVWAHSVKGAAGQLHSRAIPIIDALLDHHRDHYSADQAETLALVFTSICHHCSTTHLVPVVQNLLDRLEVPSADPSTSQRGSFGSSAYVLPFLSTLLYTRKGKRYPEALLKPTMQKLLELSARLEDQPEEDWRRKYLTAVIGTLMAGKLEQWLSPGVAVIDRVWKSLSHQDALAFADALISLKWEGVEQFLLPHIARSTEAALDTDSLSTVRLLNTMHANGFLASGLSKVQGGRWRTVITGHIAALLERHDTTSTSPDSRRLLCSTLQLVPAIGDLEKFEPPLARIMKSTLELRLDHDAWLQSVVWNNGHLLASVLRLVNDIAHTASGERLRSICWASASLDELVSAWSWNREVLEQLALLVDASLPARFAVAPTQLGDNLLSSDALLRRSSLRILAATAVSGQDGDAPSHGDVWNACLQVEDTEMSLRNSRERPAQIARLARILVDLPKNTNDELQETARLALRYLLSQLKVNYRPNYPETIKSFGLLAPARGDHIWDLLWDQLKKTHAAPTMILPDFGVQIPAWAQADSASDQRRKVQDEEDEAEFRCPNQERMIVAVNKALSGASDAAMLDRAEIPGQLNSDRLDVLNYEAQLLAVLGHVVNIAEKHTRLLIPMFFSIAGHTDGDGVSVAADLSTRQHQHRTANWLELLSKFVNPKAAFRSDELRQIYLDILSKGDSKLQKLALDCLLTYKSPALVSYQDNLRALLDEPKFRDELAHFQFGTDSGVIDSQHRAEAIPVTIRLLYGIITARRGRTSAHGLAGRKQAVLTAMSGCASNELKTLIGLMLEPFDISATLEMDSKPHAAGRQQLGYLTLLNDVLRYLGPQTAEHWPRLLQTTIDLVRHAQQVIQDETAPEEEMEADVDVNDDEPPTGTAPLRNIRSTGIKRIVQFLRSRVDFDFAAYLPDIFASVISPRLEKLEVENTQAPSGILDLISALAADSRTMESLVTIDNRTLPKTFACLIAVKVKPKVISRVFDIIESLLSPVSDQSDSSTSTVILPHLDTLLDAIIQLVPNLKAGGNDDLLRRLLGILSTLSAIVTNGEQAQQLASLLSPMLRQPSRQLAEKAKLNILHTLQRLYAISPDFSDSQSPFFIQNHEQICNLLQTLFFPSSRRALVDLLAVFADVDTSLKDVARLVSDINAYSARRLDEPDFDRRLTAFAELNDLPLQDLYTSKRQWLPLLRSALFFIREPDELSIRTSASAILQRFISVIGDKSGGELVDTFNFVLLPSLKQIVKSKVELVRNEALSVLSHAATTCTGIPSMLEFRVLLGGEDDELNFFTNMAHIQVHRRARAIHRLRDLCDKGEISETAAATIFIPLLEHNITGATNVTDHHLVNEAILALGALTGILRWSRYNATIMRYLRLGSGRSAQQKFYIRTVSAIIDNFRFDLQSEAIVDDNGAEAPEDEEEHEEEEPVVRQPESHREVITQVVLSRLLPALSKFVGQKDETEDNIRIPVALGIVKIASALPGESSANEVLRIITTTSQILRSKDQDTRDLARDTICKIAIYLGPGWLVRVLKELRDALQRGPQKHVLAVTTHAILVQATQDDRFSDLDEAVQDAVEVSAEVVWGESGRDVESEGFKTKMREVKGAMTRGYDTFQLVSRLASPTKISAILAPVRDVLHASQAVKTMQQVDEALRRIALGLNANERVGPKDLLGLCHSLVSGNSAYLKTKRKATAARPDRFSVQMKRDVKIDDDFYHLNAHKFVAFGLDLFVTAFRRGKFDFDDIDMLSRLGPLVNAIGNGLYSTHTNVLILALKASAAIARCPLPQLSDALPLYMTNIMRILKLAGGTAESELAQTALKTLAVILRDSKTSSITDHQLKYLLEVISPDLEEPDRQSAIFALLRSIVGRKFVVPEVYDLMERISSIMVTSQSTSIQEQCRAVLIQFLLDYPQGAGRLKGQMTFLAQNLDYVYESGRISVMELLSAVFNKFSDEIISDYADLFFVALVMRLANDESDKCRTMAGALVSQLVERLPPAHRKRIYAIVRSWIGRRAEHPALGGAALSVLGLLVASSVTAKEVTESALEVVIPIIRECSADLTAAEQSATPIKLDHRLPHQALVTLGKTIRVQEAIPAGVSWTDVIGLMLFPHDWVRFDAARVLTTILGKQDGLSLFSDDELLDVARKGCLLLKGGKDEEGEDTVVDAKLADEVVKLLWIVAKRWAATGQADENLDESGDVEDADANVKDAGLSTGVNGSTKPESKAPLSWLMSRTSFLARRLIIDRPSSHIASLSTDWSRPVTSILRFFAGAYDVFSETQAKRYSRHVLAPIYRILDEGGDLANVEEDEAVESLKALATEVRDFVQGKIGTSEFSQVWESLRKKVRETREGRREAKNTMAVANPQAWANRKEKRGEMKKEAKKRKIKAFADVKQRERPTKRRQRG